MYYDLIIRQLYRHWMFLFEKLSPRCHLKRTVEDGFQTVTSFMRNFQKETKDYIRIDAEN